MSRHKQTRPDTSPSSRVDSWKAPSTAESPTVDQPEPTDLLTAQEAADLVGVSRKTVDRRVIAKGDRRLPSWPGERNGKEVRLVSRTDVLALWPEKGTRPDMSGHARTSTAEPEKDRTGRDIAAQNVRTGSANPQEAIDPDDLAQLRAAAGRVPDLEARAEGAEEREADARAQVVEERRERRTATAAVLRQLQTTRDLQLGGGEGPVLQLAGPVPEEVRSSRRFAYWMAAASVIAVGVLGWRLVVQDAQLANAGERIDSVVGEKALVAQEAARFAGELTGELNATRETLRDERERTAALERLAVEAQREVKEAREMAAVALGVRTMLRTASGR